MQKIRPNFAWEAARINRVGRRPTGQSAFWKSSWNVSCRSQLCLNLSKCDCRNQSKGLTVVLVDDSAPVRQALQRLFSAMPEFKIVGEAQDGYAALEAITKLQPNLIILDIRMPRMNGLEVLQALKTQAWGGNVIVFSQYGEEAYRDKCFELGARHFFDKVSDFEEFHCLLKEIQSRCLKPRRPRS